jgi:tyrosyl-tRNA synthetase
VDTPDPDMDILDLLAVETGIFASRGEARRLVTGGGVSINKQKVDQPDRRISRDDFINHKYLIVQKGKKNYYLIRIKDS